MHTLWPDTYGNLHKWLSLYLYCVSGGHRPEKLKLRHRVQPTGTCRGSACCQSVRTFSFKHSHLKSPNVSICSLQMEEQIPTVPQDLFVLNSSVRHGFSVFRYSQEWQQRIEGTKHSQPQGLHQAPEG